MRLERLQLRNWRCFPSCDIALDQHITVLIGQNGSGKTALLNAFVWGLYGETTEGFSEPTDLCNHQAKFALSTGETAEVEVSVTFRHDIGGDEYRFVAQRSIEVKRTGPGDSDFDESAPRFELNRYPTSTGQVATATGDRAEKELREILPVGLNPYFFFPAENIGASIGAPDARASSIEQAVDILLGTKLLEIARVTIRETLKLPQLKQKTADDMTLGKAQQKADAAREAYEKVATRLDELPDEIKRTGEILARAENALERRRGAIELINERNSIQRLYDEAQRDAEEAEARQREILNRECFNLFGSDVLRRAREALAAAKTAGNIPPKVSAGLLDDLIENTHNNCICGRAISEPERQALRDLRSTVVEDTLAEAASTVLARVTDKAEQLSRRSGNETPHAELRAAAAAMHDAHAEMKTQLSKRLAFDEEHPLVHHDAPPEDPFETWKHFKRIHDDLDREQGNLKRQRAELLQQKRDAAHERDRVQRQHGKADNARRARTHLERVEQAVEDLQNHVRPRSRADIERAINDIARDVLLRDYTIRLTPDFELEPRQNGIRIGAASSDRAWVTFAFVGAIAGLIEKYNQFEEMDEAGNVKLEQGHGYPLVLDAPFSLFGDQYATSFAERLPQLVPQAVVIIRGDQIRHLDPIMTSNTRVRGYLMCLYGPRDIHQEIAWGDGTSWGDGSTRPYVMQAETPEGVRTEIVELPT